MLIRVFGAALYGGLFLLLLCAGKVYAAGILVLAPHPDDDVITASGVVSNAISRGKSVKVVYVTNGDINGVSIGYTREGEAVAAETTYLGTTEDDLIFLGYPDFHLQEVYTNYPNRRDDYTTPFGQSVTYGNRGLGRSDYHSYRFGSPALYNRYNIVLDLRQIISTYRPQHIYTVSEFDTHPDHSTTYQLLKLALAAVHNTDPTYTPVIHKTIVWDNFPDTNTWPPPSDPTSYFPEVPGLSQTTLTWSARESLDVPLAMQSTNYSVNPKARAIASHASQGGLNGYIGRFLRKDEFFWSENLNGSNQPPRAAAGFDQTVNQGVLVQLNGTASTDPEGSLLTYQWTQTAGPTVGLINAASATPSFTAPSGLSQNTTLGFQLVVSDGSLSSAPDLVNVTVQAAQTSSNIAGLATVTASSQNTSTGQTAIKAVDGVVDGYPGDYTREWATVKQKTGAWLKLAWGSAYTIDQVVLHDRPNTNDQITSATLSFSDGSSVTVGILANDGTGVTVNFAPRTVTGLTLTVTGVSGTTTNVGLAEIEVHNAP